MKGANQVFADSVFLAVKGYIDVVVARFIKQEIAPIERRLTELPPGRDGKDADADAIAEVVLGKVVKALEAVPPPKDGRDGKDADPEVTKAAVTAEVERVLATWPKPRDGVAGKDGRDGLDGKDGKDGVDGKSISLDEVRALLADMVQKAVAQIPPPKDGKDGVDADPEFIRAEVQRAVDLIPKPRDGRDGMKGERGEPGRDGIGERGNDGRDGRDADPELVRQEVEIAIAKMPKPERGEPGADGLGVDDFEVSLEGRTLTLGLRCGDRVVTRQVKLAGLPDYKGIYAAGSYEAGDMVTYGGSIWRAKRDTSQAPKGSADDWHLVVKGAK